MFIFTYIFLLLSNNFKILSICSSNCCNCCNCCRNRIVNNNENNSKNKKDDSKNNENAHKITQSELDKLDEKYKNDVDFEYLSENLEYVEDLKMYIDIKNLYSDEIPDISNIKDITTDEILSFLKINEAQNEINKCGNIKEKVKKLSEIISDDYKNRRFTFENSNLLVPRCLIVHENNNCCLEAYFSYLESNPYYCKFFWLLNNLFENNNLNKDNLPITFEVCQFFKNSINNPNFNDKIHCLKISETWYNNVEKLKNKMDSNLKKDIEEYLESRHFGSFQSIHHAFYVIKSVILELKDYYDFKYYINESKNENNGKHYIFHFNKIFYAGRNIDIDDINEQNCKDYLFKADDKNTITCKIFSAVGYHFYTIRNINGVFFNYDSLKYKKKPEVISYKDFIKIWLNFAKYLKNFNGDYKDYEIHCFCCFSEKYI